MRILSVTLFSFFALCTHKKLNSLAVISAACHHHRGVSQIPLQIGICFVAGLKKDLCQTQTKWSSVSARHSISIIRPAFHPDRKQILHRRRPQVSRWAIHMLSSNITQATVLLLGMSVRLKFDHRHEATDNNSVFFIQLIFSYLLKLPVYFLSISMLSILIYI